MGEFQTIGEIMNNEMAKRSKWQPPVEQDKKCPYCGNKMLVVKNFYKGWVAKNVSEDRYTLDYICPNKCKEREIARAEHSKRYKKAKECWANVGFSRECVGWNLNKLTCENIEYLRMYASTFNRFSKAVVMKGLKGTGKTLSSECIAKYLTKNGKKVKITNMTEINIEMNRYLRKDKYEDFFKEIMRLDLIIIDDFGREQYNTEKSLENVFQFFNNLTKERKPFIVSVNPEMLAIIASKPQLDACLDRFKKSSNVKILEFKNKSFRQ